MRHSAPGIWYLVDAQGVVRTTMRGVVTSDVFVAHIRARSEAGILCPRGPARAHHGGGQVDWARMYAALGVRDDPGFAVFRTMTDAEAWLAE